MNMNGTLPPFLHPGTSNYRKTLSTLPNYNNASLVITASKTDLKYIGGESSKQGNDKKKNIGKNESRLKWIAHSRN